MTPIYAITILLIVFALGEAIAQKSKAMVSTTLFVAVALLVGFWIGLPHDIFVTAAVNKISGVLIGVLIVSMGTTINIAELIRQWKTVVIGFVAVGIAVFAIIFIGQAIIGRDLALAGAPIFAGANVAALIMTEAFTAKGTPELGVFCVLVLVTQNFVGIPIASLLCKQEARAFIKDSNLVKKYQVDVGANSAVSKKKLIPALPEAYQKPFIILAKLGLVACLSFFISGLTNGSINYLVICLLMGIVATEIGFLEVSSLTKANSMGLVLFLTTVAVFGNLPQATPSVLISQLLPLLVVLGIGVIGVGISSVIFGKILRVPFRLAFALGLTCTFGFPTTYFIPEEVSEAIGTTAEEKLAIKNYIMPKMISAGFATVSIASVVIVGFIANMI